MAKHLFHNRVIRFLLSIIGMSFLLCSCTWFALRPYHIFSLFSPYPESSLAIDSDDFIQAMDTLAGHKHRTHNELVLLQNGNQIFPALLELIENARKYVFIDQYVFLNDEVGNTIAEALKKRAQEGVEICIVYDYVGSRRASRSFWNDLSASTIKVRPFNPLPWWTVIRANNRDHRKMVIVDGTAGLIGDFGISREYGGDGESNGSWRCNALLMRGPAVAELEAAFLESWEEAGHGIIKKDLPVPLLNLLWDIPLSLVGGSEDELEKQSYAHFPPGNNMVWIVRSTPSWGSHRILDAFLLALNAARNSIHITQSYFIPDRSIRRALIAAARRGVDVTIILPHEADVHVTKSAAQVFYEELLAGGVRIFERPGTMLHAKTMVIDGIWSSLGSCNIDDRSFFLSYECTAVVVSSEFGSNMEEMFARDLAGSQEITLRSWKKRSWWKRLKLNLIKPFVKQL